MIDTLRVKMTMKRVSIGTLKIINFPFVPNGKLIISGVPEFRQMNGVTESCPFCSSRKWPQLHFNRTLLFFSETQTML